MKKILITLAILVLTFGSDAQIQIKPLSKPGFEKRIRNYIDHMKVVDTHEHVWGINNEGNKIEALWVLCGYSYSDILSAGLPLQDYEKLGDTITTKEKWKIIKPYYEGMSNTAYNRTAILAADKLFGIKTIDSTTYEVLSEKIKEAHRNHKDWFYKIIDKSGIEYIIDDIDDWEVHKNNPSLNYKIFKFVNHVNDFIYINSSNDIKKLLKWRNSGINSVNDLVSALEANFQASANERMVGIKTDVAYYRTLLFNEVSKGKAEDVFNKIQKSSTDSVLPFEEVKPLQDYMMHRILELAEKYNIPVQIHTGLQSGFGNIIENSKPTLLVNLFQKYPDVKFILFHGAYPYGGELSTLAKNFRNVYIDMCWLYIISPSYSERYLHEWLETVPASKIMAFGGDIGYAETIYSHLLMAKQVVSNVLIAKVKGGYFTEDEGIKIAQMILHDNAVRIFNLKK